MEVNFSSLDLIGALRILPFCLHFGVLPINPAIVVSAMIFVLRSMTDQNPYSFLSPGSSLHSSLPRLHLDDVFKDPVNPSSDDFITSNSTWTMCFLTALSDVSFTAQLGIVFPINLYRLSTISPFMMTNASFTTFASPPAIVHLQPLESKAPKETRSLYKFWTCINLLGSEQSPQTSRSLPSKSQCLSILH